MTEPSLPSLLGVKLRLLCVGKPLSCAALQGVLKSLQGSVAKVKGHKQKGIVGIFEQLTHFLVNLFSEKAH